MVRMGHCNVFVVAQEICDKKLVPEKRFITSKPSNYSIMKKVDWVGICFPNQHSSLGEIFYYVH